VDEWLAQSILPKTALQGWAHNNDESESCETG
jgi:hypothetical protein